jgi:hypothetical protein
MEDEGPEEALARFNAELLAAQEPLGKEFESVLYDNLWELYRSAAGGNDVE